MSVLRAKCKPIFHICKENNYLPLNAAVGARTILSTQQKVFSVKGKELSWVRGGKELSSLGKRVGVGLFP